jgi:hypothetical protein
MELTFHAGDFDSPDVRALLAMHYGIMRSISPHRACHVFRSKASRTRQLPSGQHATMGSWSVSAR